MTTYDEATNTYTLADVDGDFEVPINPAGGPDATVIGNAQSNIITGNAGNNVLNGGLGTDTLVGDLGDDSYVIDDAGDVVIELADQGINTVLASIDIDLSLAMFAGIDVAVLTGTANLDATGNDLSNELHGNSGNNLLSGGKGDDYLAGNGGLDELAGGEGDDSYVIDDDDHIIEEVDKGRDTVEITAAYTGTSYILAGSLENLTLTGTRDFDGTGNGLNNLLVGNSGRNVLNGDVGSDTLNGGGGDDALNGGDGSDLLDGGSGADVMIGGIGDDLYIVDSVSDVVTEQAGGGTFDRVVTKVSYTLGSNLEYLAMENGAGNIVGTGNALDNTMFGNDGNNVVDGGGGRDQLNGATGNDTVYGGEGDDTINESGDGNDVLNGGAGNDDLRAEGGNDVLDGGTGADQLKGGMGNDSYIVDNALDVVLESAAGGADIVSATTSFTLALGSSVETLTAAAGTAAYNLSGNEEINTVLGNSGRNTISGMAGNDVLSVGKGKDIFVFSTALGKTTNLDKITDFSVKDDTIYLENDIFKKIGIGTFAKPGKLKKSFFAINKAKDKNDYIVYKSKTGVLSYDSDGSGKTKAVDFAVLKKGLLLAAPDFFII